MNDNTTSIIDILNGSRRPSQPSQRPPQRPPQRPDQRPDTSPKRPPSQPSQRPPQRPDQRPPQRPDTSPKRPPSQPSQRPPQRPPQRPDQRPDTSPKRPPSQPSQRPPQRPDQRPPVIITPPVEVPASPLDVRSGPLTSCGSNQITLTPSSTNRRTSINIYPGSEGWLSQVPSSSGLKICRGIGSVDLQAYANSNNGIYALNDLSPNRNDPLWIRGPSQNAVAQGVYSTVSGGVENYIGASGIGSSIGGGSFNRIAPVEYNSDGSFRGINYSTTSSSSMYSTIAGGRYNLIGSYGSTVAGGVMNISTGPYSTIGGGKNNQINHQGATIPGGIGLISVNNNHTVLGKYNDLTNDGLTYNASCFNHDPNSPPEIAFSIGWGEEDNRVDIFRIYSNGDVWTAGNFSSCPQ